MPEGPANPMQPDHTRKQQEPHRLPLLADLQTPRNLHVARQMAELSASFCLTVAQSRHLELRTREENSLRIGLASSAFQMGGRDRSPGGKPRSG